MSLPPVEIPLGAMRFNSDSQKLEYFNGEIWMQIHTFNPDLDGGVRGLFAGGYNPSPTPGACIDTVDYITIAKAGNGIDFGNLTESKQGGGNCGDSTRAVYAGGRVSTTPGGSCTNKIEITTFATKGNYADSGGDLSASIMCSGLSNSTRGIFAGFIAPYADTIDYITIQSIGNAVDFGNLTQTKGYTMQCASPTRGLIFGGINNPSVPSIDDIDYVTIASTGNAQDFGEIIYANGSRYEGTAISNSTRAVQAAGYGPNYTNDIEYVTIATKGNTTHFGDLSAMNGTGKGGASSPTRGIIAGGYVHPTTSDSMEYITFATTGDGVDFGNLTSARRMPQSGCSNGHGGLG
jgi:hypothetical protein